MSLNLRAAIALISVHGLAAAALAETGAVSTSSTEASAPAKAGICAPGDQLACSCPANKHYGANDLVTPCFLGDLNRAVATQTDPYANIVFSALNWPKAAGRGVPDYAALPNAPRPDGNPDYVTVWDSWPAAAALFRPDLSAPQDWDAAAPILPEACAAIALDSAKTAFGWAEVPQGAPVRLLGDYIDPDGHALIDASGQPVRYEVLYNRQAYEYVTENALWDAGRLAQYVAVHGKLDFPSGQWDTGDTGVSARGAIVLKAAWKVLDQTEDDPRHFHKSWTFLSPVIQNGTVNRTACELRPVGLIGLHIAIKTVNFPDWLWTTFDHVAAAPGWGDLPAVQAGTSNPYAQTGEPAPATVAKNDWLFFTPQQGECLSDCRIAGPLNAAVMVTAATQTLPTRQSRIIQIQPRGYYFEVDRNPRSCDVVLKSNAIGAGLDASAPVVLGSYADMDCLMRDGFGDSVMRNYQLKGAQWLKPNTGTRRVPLPDVLANTVLEAFSQADSSCVACHRYARPETSTSTAEVYDYMFSVGRPGIAVVADPGASVPAASND